MLYSLTWCILLAVLIENLAFVVLRRPFSSLLLGGVVDDVGSKQLVGSRTCEYTMSGHEGFILNVFQLEDEKRLCSELEDKKRLCSVDTEGSIKIWNVGSTESMTLLGHYSGPGMSGGVMWVIQLSDGRCNYY